MPFCRDRVSSQGLSPELHIELHHQLRLVLNLKFSCLRSWDLQAYAFNSKHDGSCLQTQNPEGWGRRIINSSPYWTTQELSVTLSQKLKKKERKRAGNVAQRKDLEFNSQYHSYWSIASRLYLWAQSYCSKYSLITHPMSMGYVIMDLVTFLVLVTCVIFFFNLVQRLINFMEIFKQPAFGFVDFL